MTKFNEQKRSSLLIVNTLLSLYFNTDKFTRFLFFPYEIRITNITFHGLAENFSRTPPLPSLSFLRPVHEVYSMCINNQFSPIVVRTHVSTLFTVLNERSIVHVVQVSAEVTPRHIMNGGNSSTSFIKCHLFTSFQNKILELPISPGYELWMKSMFALVSAQIWWNSVSSYTYLFDFQFWNRIFFAHLCLEKKYCTDCSNLESFRMKSSCHSFKTIRIAILKVL